MADARQTRVLVQRWASQVHTRASGLVLQTTRDAAPVESGDTRRGVRLTPRGPLSSVLESTTSQGEWVNDGTRPHVIRPRQAKALRFRAGGRIVYAARVNHPGIKATHWFDGATQTWSRALGQAAASQR